MCDFTRWLWRTPLDPRRESPSECPPVSPVLPPADVVRARVLEQATRRVMHLIAELERDALTDDAHPSY